MHPACQWRNCRWACRTIMWSRLKKGRHLYASALQFSDPGVMRKMIKNKIAFIGGGQMAEALIGGLLEGRVCAPELIWATDPLPDRRDRLKSQFAIRVGADNREAIAWADIALLAVKPQTLPDVLKETHTVLGKLLVISIVAGATICSIAERMAASAKVIRAMPNTPALVREGMTALAQGPCVSEDEMRLAWEIFESVGRVVLVEERLMDAVTGLSGSGPAYVF